MKRLHPVVAFSLITLIVYLSINLTIFMIGIDASSRCDRYWYGGDGNKVCTHEQNVKYNLDHTRWRYVGFGYNAGVRFGEYMNKDTL